MKAGIFERYQLLLGFEDALCSFYEYTDETEETLETLTQFKIDLIGRIMTHPSIRFWNWKRTPTTRCSPAMTWLS